MNRRASNRHNPFKSEPSNHNNRQQNEASPSNSHNKHNASSGNSFNQGQRNNQLNNSYRDCPNNSPQSKQFNGQQFNDSTPSPPQAATTRSGPCVVCKSTTVLICARCGDFYCSPTCQKNDWQTHRFICFLMPKLVSSSIDIYQNLPSLNGYQNRELPETMQVPANVQSQNKKWVGNSPSTASNNMQSNNNNTQRQQPQQQQQQQNSNQQQRPQRQQQNDQRQNRQTPPPRSVNGSEKAFESNDANRATNIGKVEQAAFPKSNSSVLVTAIRSSNRIFIRSIEKAENDGYCAVLKTINQYGAHAKPLTTMPTKNAFAITDFNNDGVYYRVQVVSAKDENNIHVIYFDFGNEATKKLSELKDISLQCASLKQYVLMVTLKGVSFVRDNPKLLDYMKSFEDIEAKIVYSDRDKPAVEIVLDGVEDSLNKKINIFIQKSKNDSEPQVKPLNQQQKAPQAAPAVKQETQRPVSEAMTSPAPSTVGRPKARPSQIAKPVMVPPFEQINLPIKATNLNVMIVDNSLIQFHYLGCVLLEDKVNLQDIQNYLNDYQDTGKEYKPKIEEYCLAKFQDGWYRAKVIDILPSDIVEVVFIDFLNESEVSIKDIRRYPMDLDLPCKTTLCLIQGLPEELTDSQVDYLKEKLQPGSELKINEVVEKLQDGGNVAVCKINQVLQWMAQDNP